MSMKSVQLNFGMPILGSFDPHRQDASPYLSSLNKKRVFLVSAMTLLNFPSYRLWTLNRICLI